MLKRNRIVRGLIEWLTGSVSTRIELLERDLLVVEREQRRLRERERGVERVLADHHQRLTESDAGREPNAAQAISLRRMHAALADRIGEAFPHAPCESCGAPLVFEHNPAERAYELACAHECGERLLLPEAQLLESLDSGKR